MKHRSACALRIALCAFILTGLTVTPSFAAVKVAITVDDLPTHGKLPPGVTREDVARKLVAAFKKHGVTEAYGFINSGKVKEEGASAETLKIWTEAGFPLGNHTYLHRSIEKVTVSEFKREIDRNEATLKELSGGRDWKWFRYPYLHEGSSMAKRNAIRAYLKKQGYRIAQVTIDFEDWSWNDPYARCAAKGDTKTIEWMKQTYLKNAEDHLARAQVLAKGLWKREIGHVLLLHVGAFDAEIMDDMLALYKSKGVEFVSLAEASRDKVYSIDPKVAAKWGSELTYQTMAARKLSLSDFGLERYLDFPKDELAKACL